MKRLILILTSALIPAAAFSQIEEVTDDSDLFAPFRTVYRSADVEFVDHTDPAQVGSILLHQRKMVHSAMNEGMRPHPLVKVGVRTGVSASDDASTVRAGGRSSGADIMKRNSDSKKRQVARQAQFAARQRAARIDAARKAAARQRARRIADNNRAAAVTAATNAALQGATDARISRDCYNAGPGRELARRNVTSAATAQMLGPQPVQPATAPKISGAARAHALRDGRSRSRIRNEVPRDKADGSKKIPFEKKNPIEPLKPIIRPPRNPKGEYAFTGRATESQIFIKPDSMIAAVTSYNAPRTIHSNQGFRLSPNAVVTTGIPQHSESFVNTGRKIPPPVTALDRPELTPGQEWDMILKEMLD